jgi:hypothetical protein
MSIGIDSQGKSETLVRCRKLACNRVTVSGSLVYTVESKMFVERRINATTGAIELWWCEWEKGDMAGAKKIYVNKIADEANAVGVKTDSHTEESAICWSYGRTLGNIAVFSPTILGSFPDKHGDNAILPCDFVTAGKFRHGAPRWWCRTHQTHWGTKADEVAYANCGEMRCAFHEQQLNYVVNPPVINLNEADEVGIWCSMPAAIATADIPNRAPKIHVHVRPKANGPKSVDRDFQAVSLRYSGTDGLFAAEEITRVNVTPPAAFEFVVALERGVAMDCVNCSHCGYPHLDLGEFARKAHRKHFCGNCGRDSTWSKEEIISTPLQPLHDRYAKTLKYETPDRHLDLDKMPGHTYAIWASTPAVVWTASRPQEFGIHVHVYHGGRRVIDDTFGEVRLGGKNLDRSDLMDLMINRSIV